MEYGIQLFGCMDLYNANAEMLLDKLKTMGYSHVEPCILFGDDSTFEPNLSGHLWRADEMDRHFALLKRCGLSLSSCHLFAANPEAELVNMKAFAYTYGVSRYVVGCSGPFDMASLRDAADSLARLADSLAVCGLELWLHNGPAEIEFQVEGMSALEWLVRVCGGKVGLQIDTGWATCGGANLKAFLVRNAGFVRSIHHKDVAAACANPVNVHVGSGVVDTVSAFEFARDRHLGQLIDQDASEGDLLDDLAAGIRYLRHLEQSLATE